MNLFYAEVTAVLPEVDGLMGTIKVHGATKKISFGLLTDVARGDTVLVCDGVAISKVEEVGKSQ